MARQRNKYPREFKLELLRQIEDGEKTASELCRELGLSLQQVSAWRRQLAVKGDEAFPGQGQKRGAAADLAELRKENERLREENEILKKGSSRNSGSSGSTIGSACTRQSATAHPVSTRGWPCCLNPVSGKSRPPQPVPDASDGRRRRLTQTRWSRQFARVTLSFQNIFARFSFQT